MSKLNRLISEGAGRVNPVAVEDYVGLGGFAALKKAAGLAPDCALPECHRTSASALSPR